MPFCGFFRLLTFFIVPYPVLWYIAVLPFNLRWEFCGFGYCRKIDQLEGKNAKVFTKRNSPYKGKIFLGRGGIPCLGTDKNGDDIDGITFTPANGGGIIFIEDDIEEIEFID